MPTPPRRWFAFRLRTLFVLVAVVAVGLGLWLRREQRIVDERRAMVEWVYRGKFGRASSAGEVDGTPSWQKISRVRRVMGDEPIEEIVLPWEANEADCERAKYLFPEASYVGQGFF